MFCHSRPVGKENTAHVGATHHNNFLLLCCVICAIILWRVICVKLNIRKKITGLEIMTLNDKKIQHVSKLTELMFKGELHCLGMFYKVDS